MTRTPKHIVRVACAAAIALGTAGGLAACGTDVANRAAIAAAKCVSPVSDKAGVPQNLSAQTEGVTVESLGGGRYRVAGTLIVTDEVTTSVAYICEVAPDATDKLRGFKVTRIEITPTN